MIASADGRADGRRALGGLGHPADRALLRELRSGGRRDARRPGTLRAERYANLLDDDQRARRAARAWRPSRSSRRSRARLDVPSTSPLFAEPGARDPGLHRGERARSPARGAEVDGRPLRPGDADAAPRRSSTCARERGVRPCSCEGGPTLLRALVAAGLRRRPRAHGRAAAGGRRRRPTSLSGAPLDPPAAAGAARRPPRRRPPVPALRRCVTAPPLRLRERTRRRSRPGRPLLMGIVNAGPGLVLRRGAAAARSTRSVGARARARRRRAPT